MRIVSMEVSPPAELSETIHSSTIADVLDGFGVWGVIPHEVANVQRSRPRRRLVGRAYTVRWGAVRRPADTHLAPDSVREQMRELLVTDVLSGVGFVYVAGVEGGLLPELALADGLCATEFTRRGFEGLLLGGGVRDAHVIESLDFPVWATNYAPADTQGNYRIVETGAWCRIGNILINTGDWIVADATGCVVIPSDLMDVVSVECTAIERTRREIEIRMDQGESLFAIVCELGDVAPDDTEVPAYDEVLAR